MGLINGVGSAFRPHAPVESPTTNREYVPNQDSGFLKYQLARLNASSLPKWLKVSMESRMRGVNCTSSCHNTDGPWRDLSRVSTTAIITDLEGRRNDCIAEESTMDRIACDMTPGDIDFLSRSKVIGKIPVEINSSAFAPDDTSAKRGEVIYQSSCSDCHDNDEVPDMRGEWRRFMDGTSFSKKKMQKAAEKLTTSERKAVQTYLNRVEETEMARGVDSE